jgi:hypothetical protein
MNGGGAAGGGGTAGAGGSAGAGPCAPAAALVCMPMQPFPASIRDTGLFPALPDLSMHHASAHLFQPDPPLWSDGLAKERLIVLPGGTSVDTQDPAHWQFPMGALLVKTFFDDGGPNGARRPIETRFIRHSQDPANPFSQWEFAVYRWNAGGNGAALVSFADPDATTMADVIVNRMEDGKLLKLNDGAPFTHVIPSQKNCQACHDGNAGLTGADVIGFDETRLAAALPGQAMTQLESLAAAGVLSKAPATPATPAKIEDADPVLQRVKRWVFGNCVHCHNGVDGMADFRPEKFVANTVNQASEGAGIMPPSPDWKRIVPKQPELSVLFVQVRRSPLPMGPSVQMRAMPPVGVAIAQSDAVADLQTWINSLQ